MNRVKSNPGTTPTEWSSLCFVDTALWMWSLFHNEPQEKKLNRTSAQSQTNRKQWIRGDTVICINLYLSSSNRKFFSYNATDTDSATDTLYSLQWSLFEETPAFYYFSSLHEAVYCKNKTFFEENYSGISVALGKTVTYHFWHKTISQIPLLCKWISRCRHIKRKMDFRSFPLGPNWI